MSKYAITTSEIYKSFGKNDVLKGINLKVERGTMLALLGPNGAGKTTTVRILSTLLDFDSGNVEIEGFDLKKSPNKIRDIIGLTGQSATVDELLTGKENLVMMGRLYRLTPQSANIRAIELLEEFDLTEAANRPAKTYSGGMRRRLDLAVSLIATPPIIFLDEPTTGLDPRSRISMWNIINSLKQNGSTILLTTQYLEEADQLADKIAVIDGGKVIAEGTSAQLKAKVGKDRLELKLKSAECYNKAAKLLAKTITSKDPKEKSLTLVIEDVNKDVNKALSLLAKNSVNIDSMSVHKPTLDDVFLSITGKSKGANE